MPRDAIIENVFPKIGTDYQITSPKTPNHNCIAFAAGDTTRFWWPKKYFWPREIPEEETLEAFIACYESLGFEKCGMNTDFEIGYEKVAVFVDPSGTPTHAAKQFGDGNGKWKSKLGVYYDIEHTIEGISGWHSRNSYGDVAQVLKRIVKS